MNNEEIRKKEEIESALAAMIDGDFLETSKELLAVLGLPQRAHCEPSRERRMTLFSDSQPGTRNTETEAGIHRQRGISRASVSRLASEEIASE